MLLGMSAVKLLRLTVSLLLQLLCTSVFPYVCPCVFVVNSEISRTLSYGLKLCCQKHMRVYCKLFIAACFKEMLM